MKHFILPFVLIALMPATLVSAQDAKSSYNVVNNAFEQIEKRFFDFLTGGPSIDLNDPDVTTKIKEINNSAAAHWKTMVKMPDRAYIWPDLPMAFGNANLLSTSYEMTNTFLRLSVMCQAYRTKGGELYNNKVLGKDLLSVILWMTENKYKIDGKTYGNWWDWRIGSPLRFIDCIVMMKNDMTEEQYKKCTDVLRVYVEENAPAPGDANSMWNMFIRLMTGVLCKDDAYLKRVIHGMDNVWFRYSTTRDGFFTDGSYLMHSAHPYTGSYGASAIESAAKLAYLVNGTKYDISQASKNLAIRWIHEAYSPVLYNGLMMDMTRGRSMSRETEGDHMIGHVIIRSMYLFTLIAPEKDAQPVQELIKYWITKSTYRSIFQGEDVTNNNNYLFFINELKRLMKNSSIRKANQPVFHKQFPVMTRIVHSMPGFTFAISMYSHIVKNYESINRENLKGWNTAAGMIYLYNSDMGQFSDDYWPTVDSYRLPGTTVIQGSETPAHTFNGDSWVGGTSINNRYGIAGMYLKPRRQTLEAKKSWFMFDDEIVALGSNISSSDSVVVETVIENRKLKPDNSNTFVVNGKVQSATILSNPTWAHLSGNSANSDIGYYFPTISNVHILREERAGNWRSINNNPLASSDSLLKANYLTLYFDHGVNPINGSYAYVILPGKSVEQVKKYAKNPDIIVLENSDDVHTVYEKKLRITGANFWNDVAKTSGLITSDRKSSIIVQENGADILVSVSDPTQRSGIITVQVERSASECLSKDDNINILQLSPVLLFTVDVTGKNGLPSCILFKK